MKKRTTMLLLLAMVAFTVSAQSSKDETGREVKRIVFNGEQTTVIYADGTQQSNVETARVKASSGVATKLNSAQVKKASGRSNWYTTDGRQLSKVPTTKGIYIERRNGKNLKRIKK